MKKNLLITVLVLLTTMFLVSCSGGVPQANHLFFIVTNWNAGPAVKNAEVTVFDSETGDYLGTGQTNETGMAAVALTQIPQRVDVSVMKATHARSRVVGLKAIHASEKLFPVILPNALFNPNPFTETDPVVEIEVQQIVLDSVRDNVQKSDTAREVTLPITGPFKTMIHATAQKDVKFIYQPLLERIPGDASVTSDVDCVEDADQAMFEISPTGFDGECALYSVVYDANNNRVLTVDYLEIEGTDPDEVDMYKPMPFVDFSESYMSEPLENIRSYTRREAIELRTQDRISPDEANLWAHLYWADWNSLNAYRDTNPEIADFGDEPDGYNIYRSPDGITYEKFAFVSEESIALRAKTIEESVEKSIDVDAVLNQTPFFKDGSPFIHPGYPIYYRISSVYGTLESEPTDLGSVIPLDVFDVELISPGELTRSASLSPDFQWAPNKVLVSDEGTVVYNYGLYLYEPQPLAKNIIVPATAQNEFFRFQTESTDSMSVHFSANTPEEHWNCVWKRYNPQLDDYLVYESASLDAQTTYTWEINLAYALVKDDDSKAYSIASDYKYDGSGWNIDPLGPLESSEQLEFTTIAQ